jgi:t-SNARE complex subunit (syntaxin)
MPSSSRAFSVNELSPDTVKSIESKIAAGNLMFEEAIKQVTEKNKKLEEDIALLQRARSKRTMALIITAIIIVLISVFYKYYT